MPTLDISLILKKKIFGAALYFVREGSFTLEKNKGEDTSQVADGDYFGVDILRDQNKDGKKHSFSVLP